MKKITTISIDNDLYNRFKDSLDRMNMETGMSINKGIIMLIKKFLKDDEYNNNYNNN